MNFARKILVKASQKLELPADVTAGLPKMELIGAEEFSLEPHHGLLEYSGHKISVATVLGPITVMGQNMEIKLMNSSRITVIGRIGKLFLGDEHE